MAILPEIGTPRLRIVPFEGRHLTERYISWLNDPEVVRYSEQRYRRHDRASCREYQEHMHHSDGYFCAIENVENNYEHIGNISVSVDSRNQVADVSIMIGERRRWAAGLGFEAWNAVLRALLEREGFRKVTAGTVAPNRAMIKIMEKSGMRPDGRRKAHYLVNGEAVDVIHYASFSDNAR